MPLQRNEAGTALALSEPVCEYGQDAMADYARGTLRSTKKQLEELWTAVSASTSVGCCARNWSSHRIGRTDCAPGAGIERRTEPYAETLGRLATIPGIDRITAWTLLGRTGGRT